VNKYARNENYSVKVPQDQERNMLIKLFDNRRSMTIKQLAADIRKNVSIFGIFNQSWKHKEMLIKIEGVKKKLQSELDKSHSHIVKIKDKLKS